jgi:hypothetical protein
LAGVDSGCNNVVCFGFLRIVYFVEAVKMISPRIITDKHEQYLKGQKRRLWKARAFNAFVFAMTSLGTATLLVQIGKLLRQWK